MEIFTILESLEDLIENSRNLPFSSKGIVDKDELLDLIKEVRIKLPDELKQAKWVKEERQRILVEAQKEADGIVKEAENRIISMIDEHEITRKAYEQKKEIIESANERSREISNGTKEYADNLLAQTEDVLTLRSIYERDRFDGGYIDSKTNNGCKEIDDKITIDTGIFLFDIDSDLKELYITSYMSSPSDNNYNFNRYLKIPKKTNFDSSAYRLIGVFDNGNEKRYASIKIDNPNPTRDCNLGGDGSE